MEKPKLLDQITGAIRAHVSYRFRRSTASLVNSWRTKGTRGFMKALLDMQHDRILGFTMLGTEAGEIVAVVQTAMLAGLPYTGLRDAIFTYPTMAEGLTVLFANVPSLSM